MAPLWTVAFPFNSRYSMWFPPHRRLTSHTRTRSWVSIPTWPTTNHRPVYRCCTASGEERRFLQFSIQFHVGVGINNVIWYSLFYIDTLAISFQSRHIYPALGYQLYQLDVNLDLIFKITAICNNIYHILAFTPCMHDAAPSLWNKLPLHIGECDSVAAFKSTLKTLFQWELGTLSSIVSAHEQSISCNKVIVFDQI